MKTDSFASTLRDALTRAPDSAWIREDLAIVGWGESLRIDPGTGADRFDRALRVLRSSGAPLALASFTFDENVAGSMAIVPDVILRVDPAVSRFLIGSREDLPGPHPVTSLPEGRLVESGEAEWAASVERALRAISARGVEKGGLSIKVIGPPDTEVP